MRRFQWILVALCFSVSGAAWADSPDPCCVADVNGDGVVNEADYEYCTIHWDGPSALLRGAISTATVHSVPAT